MRFVEYNPISEKGSCVLRTFTKLFNKDYKIIKEELTTLAKSLNYNSYNEIEVFEKYLSNNNYIKIDGNNILVSDLKLENGKYAIFAYKFIIIHIALPFFLLNLVTIFFLAELVKTEEKESDNNKRYCKYTDPHKYAGNSLGFKVYKEVGIDKGSGSGGN